ncbi:MAG: DUF3365 domain-containing protein [Nitrospirae bacterium]|nr:DUF3365 domain-containing protein [Nitrospirota bacterium]
MKLGEKIKVGLITGAITLYAIIFTVSYIHERNEAEKDAYNTCLHILADADATQAYVRDELRPRISRLLPPDVFIPEAMSSTFAARSVLKRFADDSTSGYRFKLAAMNPRNPLNTPTDAERRIIEAFTRNPELREWRGRVDHNGTEYLHVATPIALADKCLKCHGRPQDAPAGLLAMYGDTRGFGKKAGEIAIRSVMVPVKVTMDSVFARTAGMMVPLLIVIFAFSFLLLRFLNRSVANPVLELEAGVRKMEAGDYQVSVSADSGDEIGRLAGAFNHMATQIRHGMNDLDQSRKFLQSVIDGVAETVIVIDRQYRILMMNSSASRLCTQSDGSCAGDYCHKVTHGSDTPCSGVEHQCPVQEVFASGKPFQTTHVHLDADGGRHVIELSASPIFDADGNIEAIIEIGRDITNTIAEVEERKRLETMLAERRKEEFVATLAGVIAQDFNNIFTGLMGNAELLKMRSDSLGNDARLTDYIIEGCDRMAHLTKQLLAYARGGKYHLRKTSINKTIADTLDRLKIASHPELHVSLNLAEDLWDVMADPDQMIQVMSNILNNSLEAMGDLSGKSGVLTITTSNFSAAKSYEIDPGHLHPSGAYICVKIADSGPGIPESDRERVFEPFYTTKFLGRGLGLSAAQGIIQNHDGWIKVESPPGNGTTVTVCLPRAERCDETAPRQPVSAARRSAKPGVFLLVDDELQVIKLLEAILAMRNTECISVTNGLDAIETVMARKDEISFVILDIQMPGMDGRRVYTRIKKIKPELKVLIASGYDEDFATGGMLLDAGDGFIQKPFHAKRLQDRIDAMLSGKTEAEAS